jgi:hypothetical protein
MPDSDLGTDMTRETYPLARFVADSVRETGELPLWRPYLLSGAPLIGHPVGPLFYPPDWLVVILPVALALNLNVLFHLWWSGAGMYLVLRLETHLRPAPAFIGALVFAQSPKWIAHLGGGHWAIIAAVAWWPWAWLAFTRWWSTGRLRWAALLGVALGAQALNHGNYLILSGIWLGACTFGYARRGLKRWLKRAALGWGIATIALTAADSCSRF